ncbi:MAG: hypothetical protein IPJ30_23185 [Acidobacteria bacterium]|nr:hypothetical protein [Acidobacteriota bacterium]
MPSRLIPEPPESPTGGSVLSVTYGPASATLRPESVVLARAGVRVYKVAGVVGPLKARQRRILMDERQFLGRRAADRHQFLLGERRPVRRHEDFNSPSAPVLAHFTF